MTRKRLVAAIEAIHRPADEEVECWADNDNPDEHDRRFPACEATVKQDECRCRGHILTVQVCQECGYEHDGEYPAYRPWPCPTIEAVRAV